MSSNKRESNPPTCDILIEFTTGVHPPVVRTRHWTIVIMFLDKVFGTTTVIGLATCFEFAKYMYTTVEEETVIVVKLRCIETVVDG